MQRLVNGVGRRFLAYARSFVFAYRHLYRVGKEMLCQSFRCLAEFVADNSKPATAFPQLAQHVHHTIVGFRRVQVVHLVMVEESSEDLLEQRVFLAVGHSPLYEFAYAIAYEAPYVVLRMFRHTILAQGIIGARSQVAQRVEERTVKVENISLVHSLISLIAKRLKELSSLNSQLSNREALLSSEATKRTLNYFTSCNLAIYFPRMSNSMLTTEPTTMSAKFVFSRV